MMDRPQKTAAEKRSRWRARISNPTTNNTPSGNQRYPALPTPEPPAHHILRITVPVVWVTAWSPGRTLGQWRRALSPSRRHPLAATAVRPRYLQPSSIDTTHRMRSVELNLVIGRLGALEQLYSTSAVSLPSLENQLTYQNQETR